MSNAKTTSPGIKHIKAHERVDKWRNNSIANLQQSCVNIREEKLVERFMAMRRAYLALEQLMREDFGLELKSE